MCVVSNIGDVWGKKWTEHPPWPLQPHPVDIQIGQIFPQVPRQEFDALKKEVELLGELLKAAKKYDRETGQPDCEQEDKMKLLRKVAEAVGINLDDYLKPAAP